MTETTFITIATVCFWGGVIYHKVAALEKRFDKKENDSERITALEVKINSIKNIHQ